MDSRLLNFFTDLFPSRKPLALTARQTECVEDGLIWALNCLGSVAQGPSRDWVAKRESAQVNIQDMKLGPWTSSTEELWNSLDLPAAQVGPELRANGSATSKGNSSPASAFRADPGSEGRLDGGSDPRSNPVDSAIRISAHLIILSEHRPPSWWRGTAKAAHLISLLLGLGFVYTEANLHRSAAPPRSDAVALRF